MAMDLAFRDRFERKARAVASLSHPNILALFDVCQNTCTRPRGVSRLRAVVGGAGMAAMPEPTKTSVAGSGTAAGDWKS
jgi:hypothetical protein